MMVLNDITDKNRIVKGDITVEKVLETFIDGKVDFQEAVKILNCSPQYLQRRINAAGYSATRYTKAGKPRRIISEERLKKRTKNDALEAKIKLARKLGISYGKLSVMLKAGVKIYEED